MAGYGRLAGLTVAALAVGVALGVAARVEFAPVRPVPAAGLSPAEDPVRIVKTDETRHLPVSESLAFDAALQRMVTGATIEVVVSGVSTAHYRAVPAALHDTAGQRSAASASAVFLPRHHLRTVDYRQLLPSRPDLLRTSGAR